MIELYQPHPKQKEVHKAEQRYKVLNWGRRTGKSTLAVNYTLRRALKDPGRYFIIAPTYKQAKSIFWNDIIKTQVPKELIDKYNETELSIKLKPIRIPALGIEPKKNKAGEWETSTIELKGAENEEALRGVKLKGAVMDECAFMPNFTYVWEQIVSPALGDNRGWAIFISTPNGMNNHFYELVMRAKKSPELYFFSHATALDNPHFPRDEWEEQKKVIPEDQFKQEWEADFRSVQALVYPEFGEAHIIGPEEAWRIPKDGTHYMGVDFGYVDPFAAITVTIDYDGNWWIVDEVYKSGLHIDDIARLLKERMSVRHYAKIIGDAAAKTEIESLKNVNIPIVSGKKGKDTLEAGIRLLAGQMKVLEGSGKPKLFITTNCENTIKEFGLYERQREILPDGTAIYTTPIDRNNHAMDAIRYIALNMPRPMVVRKKRERHFDPITGRALD